MDEFVKTHNRVVIDKTIDALRKNGFGARFFGSREELSAFVLEMAQDCETVGVAGTHTVRALGIPSMLENAGKTLYDHWKLTPGTPEELACRKKQLTADLFLTSANAVTMMGEIVNRDGAGNRVNAMTFGPGKVVIVIGRNKITPDIDAAILRIEGLSAPVRATSLKRKTPCVSLGHCVDCDTTDRICRITSILHKQPMMSNITVAVLDEELGY